MGLRRRTWAFLMTLAIAVLGTISLYVFITGTDAGRARLARFTLERVNRAFGGRATLTIDRLVSVGARHLEAEGVALRDTAGVRVVRADYVDATFSLRALISRAILVHSLHLRGVHVDLRKEFEGPWNIAYMVAGDTSRVQTGPGFGDDVRIGELTLSDGLIMTTGPWAPHPSITGALRDSVIARRDSVSDLEFTQRGIIERQRYDVARVVAHDVVIASLDDVPASLQLDSAQVDVGFPPLSVRQAAGQVQWTGDSLNLDLPVVRLPESEGTLRGKVSWYRPGPLEYDLTIDARAAMSDVQWIWDVLPSTGGGSAVVRMHTLSDPDSVAYALQNLDVSTEGSRITGDVTVVVTPLDLALRDVDLLFQPLQSELLRRLSYDALPPEVRGEFRGRLVAERGGSLDGLLIDRLDARFDDANVRGATSTLQASGRVSFGAEPAAQNVTIADARVDLRSVTAMFPDLPRNVDGTVNASGVVAHVNLQRADVRNMFATWTDAVGNVSTVRGSAQVNYGVRNPFLNADLVFDPISMPAIARIDTTLPFRSTLAGSVRAEGPVDSLRWSASLRASDSSRIAMQGTATLGIPEWRIAGTGTITAFNVRAWLGRDSTPITSLTGDVSIDVQAGRDSAGVGGIRLVQGDLALEQQAAASRPGFNLLASMTLDDQRLRIDSARATMGGLLLTAQGAVARDSTRVNVAAVDTIQFNFEADSLGAAHADLLRLARMWEPVDSTSAASIRGLVGDSLNGTVVGSGYVFGALDAYGATFSFGGRDVRYGTMNVGGLFGSATLTGLPTHPQFETAATATNVAGIGAIDVATAEFRIGNADPARGDIILNVAAQDTSQLNVRGEYRRTGDSLLVQLDTIRFNYRDVRWANRGPALLHDTRNGQRLDSLVLISNEGRRFAATASMPYNGAVSGSMTLDRFPVGELYAYAMGESPFAGFVSGEARLAGTRDAPLIEWQVSIDSAARGGLVLPQVTSDGAYADQRLVARAMLADTLGGSLFAEARVPIDLRFRATERRLLSDSVDADITATQLALGGLGVSYTTVKDIRGVLDGRLQLGGTIDRPFARGEMAVDGLGAHFVNLGIAPADGRMLLRAVEDSLILEQFRIRSGGRAGDTLSARGAMRIAFDEPATMQMSLFANNFIAARQRDGTDVDVSANLTASGRVLRPDVSGTVVVPNANIVTDPLGAGTALDLNSPAARELLRSDEVEVVEASELSLGQLGRFVTLRNVRVELGDEVWVRTPEATVRLTGGVNLLSLGETIAPEGEISASRGVYRLNLGLVRRSFSIDSGRVRFFGNNDISPSLSVTATNMVRSAGGAQIPVRVHIGGTLDVPELTFSSPDPLYTGAPDSEIISLLIFGAPTFALDGRGQSTVRAIQGVLAPTASGLVEGSLQRLLPGLGRYSPNTIQVQTGRTGDEPGGLIESTTSLLDNLSVVAGKQIGDKLFLRLNTGVCRGSGAATNAGVSLWYGVAVEYQFARRYTAQVGVDPGAAPCSRIGGDVLPRMQFGFDVFREWVF